MPSKKTARELIDTGTDKRFLSDHGSIEIIEYTAAVIERHRTYSVKASSARSPKDPHDPPEDALGNKENVLGIVTC